MINISKPCIDVAFFFDKVSVMPRGDKSPYTDKQKRQAKHIEEDHEEKGVPAKEAERRAWATENKISGGGRNLVQAVNISRLQN